MTDTAERGRVTVLGLGLTGRAVCEHALRHGRDVAVSEAQSLSTSAVTWLRDRDIAFEQRGHTAAFLDRASVLVLSPGVPPELPPIVAARRRGVPVLSEVEYALRHGPECTVIAVTGTNGKSSTVCAIGEILRSFGRRAWVVGNIGVPLISVIDEVSPEDLLVVEISSYQLEQSPRFHPHIGVLLNVAPDHLHRHGSFERYVRAKGHLFASQGDGDVAILPRAWETAFDQGRGRRIYFDEAFPTLPSGGDALLPHEQSNLRAALAACRAALPAFDSALVPMRRVAAAFRLPHRMQDVGVIEGVRIVNDSKSTNAASAIAAVYSVRSPAVVLIGGRSKGAGYEALADQLDRPAIRSIVLFGEAGTALEAVFATRASLRTRLHRVADLTEAVNLGLELARPGDTLLFSPACSSFDAFRDFAQRGEAFAAQIRRQPGFHEGPART